MLFYWFGARQVLIRANKTTSKPATQNAQLFVSHILQHVRREGLLLARRNTGTTALVGAPWPSAGEALAVTGTGDRVGLCRTPARKGQVAVCNSGPGAAGTNRAHVPLPTGLPKTPLVADEHLSTREEAVTARSARLLTGSREGRVTRGSVYGRRRQSRRVRKREVVSRMGWPGRPQHPGSELNTGWCLMGAEPASWASVSSHRAKCGD